MYRCSSLCYRRVASFTRLCVRVEAGGGGRGLCHASFFLLGLYFCSIFHARGMHVCPTAVNVSIMRPSGRVWTVVVNFSGFKFSRRVMDDSRIFSRGKAHGTKKKQVTMSGLKPSATLRCDVKLFVVCFDQSVRFSDQSYSLLICFLERCRTISASRGAWRASAASRWW